MIKLAGGVFYMNISCNRHEIPLRRARCNCRPCQRVLRWAPDCRYDLDKSLSRRHIDWSTQGSPRNLWYMTKLPNVFYLARHRRGRAFCECDECTRDSESLLAPAGRLSGCPWICKNNRKKSRRATTYNISENCWTTGYAFTWRACVRVMTYKDLIAPF